MRHRLNLFTHLFVRMSPEENKNNTMSDDVNNTISGDVIITVSDDVSLPVTSRQ